MFKQHTNFEGLEFSHFVVVSADGLIFASARQEGKVINFLIDIDGKWVKQQVRGHFEYLPGRLAAHIREKASLGYGRIPIYRAKTLDLS